MVSDPGERDRPTFVGYGGGTSQSPLPAPPTQARGADKRDRLYDAAIARYRDVGVADTRVEDVIADAEVSWATFFRYFPRKEAVLLEPADMPPALHNAALLEVFASPARFSALVGDQPQPVIGLVAELLAEGQRRGE